MFLAFLLLPCFLCGTLAHEVCYGGTFRFPRQYSTDRFKGKLYFTPKNGQGKRLLLENGTSLEPRLKMIFGSLSLIQLTEKDSGYYTVPFSTIIYIERLTLKVKECGGVEETHYHHTFRLKIPSDSEMVEFYKSEPAAEQAVTLWNRSDPQSSSRGRMKESEWQMSDLTQADNGYYNVRKKDGTLLARTKITVQAHTKSFNPPEGSVFQMTFPVHFTPWDVNFEPHWENHQPAKYLMHGGRAHPNGDIRSTSSLEERIFFEYDRLEFDPVKLGDSGVYTFRDADGNMAFWADVQVEEVPTPAYAYVVIVGVVLAAVAICCCCCRKCCCKKKSAKSPAAAAQEATGPAAPATYYHGTNPATGPSYSAPPPAVPAATYSYQPAATYSYQPAANPVFPGEPPSFGAPAYNRVDVHPDPTPTQLEVAPAPTLTPALTLTRAAPPADDDDGPKFELKGLRFSSAPPLSTDSTFVSVYNSDKLNF
ncbi:uncharacterized protein LOC144207334 isoform X2 [Stigmatopora nigra]